MPRKAFYDPFVSDETAAAPELPPVRALFVSKPGLYVSVDDASALLALYATQYHGEGRAALLAAAGVFAEMNAGDAADELSEPPVGVPAADEPPAFGHEVYIPLTPPSPIASPSTPGVVSRVEVYPNEDGSYWYARAVDAGGGILGEPLSGVSHDEVLASAVRKWAGVTVYEVPDALSDSTWAETNPASTFNGRSRPSTRRMFGQ